MRLQMVAPALVGLTLAMTAPAASADDAATAVTASDDVVMVERRTFLDSPVAAIVTMVALVVVAVASD